LGASAERQVLTALGIGIAYVSVDTFLRSLAGWGHLPVLVGSWAAPVFMTIAVSLWSRRG
jgi:lipopolysaccharide export LptBFGC system permease protein LptF